MRKQRRKQVRLDRRKKKATLGKNETIILKENKEEKKEIM